MKTKIIRGPAFALLALLLSQGVQAAAEELIPGGSVLGIQMNTQGVLVAETPQVDTAQGPVWPARDAGLLPGDIILAVDGRPTTTAAELSAAAAELGETPVTIRLQRGTEQLELPLTPATDGEGARRLGLWLRDGIAGVGTLTYIDPETGDFGALGHGVNDAATGVLLPLGSGTVCRAEVVDVTLGLAGTPGALSGSFDMGARLGGLEKNTPCGIFGRLQTPLESYGEALPVADSDDIHSGAATIRSTVAGNEVREYDVQISRMAAGNGATLNIRVTDPELLRLTGGIVQGMSGSPIIQDGKLIGAVTHVLIDDPSRGYGIVLETMLEAAA